MELDKSVKKVANLVQEHCYNNIDLFRQHIKEDFYKIIISMFKIGDPVKLNWQSGHVSGKIIKVHHSDFDYTDTLIKPIKTISNMKLQVIKSIILQHIGT